MCAICPTNKLSPVLSPESMSPLHPEAEGVGGDYITLSLLEVAMATHSLVS